jgi:hypothetical protein
MVRGNHSYDKEAIPLKSSSGPGFASGTTNIYKEVIFRMAHENPWFLITCDELHTIQEGLHSLEKENPGTSSPYLGKIVSILHEVQDRQP